MRPSDKERLEILKIEMQLIQGTLDKYDDLIFRNRNWFITIWTGAIGLSFTIKSPTVPLLAIFLAAIYWFIEGMMRHQYWYKYVIRYRAVRTWLNESKAMYISVYDLTNHFGEQPSQMQRFRKSFFKLEPSLVYLFMGLGAVVVRYLISNGAIGGPAV
jgi:hypothetical protein